MAQKEFDKCINKKNLRFDFFIPEANLCIEYDGIQHYENIFGNDAYLKTKNNDEIKDKFCLENKISLLRIPYYDFNKIESILSMTFIVNKKPS